MLKNYFKIAIAVLKRRKFFTFISLFGISFTLTILIVITALMQHLFGPTYPESNRNRSLYIEKIAEKSEDGFSSRNNAPSFLYLNKYVEPMKTPAKKAFCSMYVTTMTIVNNKKVTLDLKYTNEDYWEVMEYKFLEGKPYNKEHIKSGEKVAVITEATKSKYFGTLLSVVGKFIESDHVQYRVIGVVNDVAESMMFTYAEMYVPYTVSDSYRKDRGIQGWQRAYFAVLLADSKEDLPKIQYEYKNVISKLPKFDKYYTQIFSHADRYIEVFTRGLTGNGTNSGIVKVFSVSMIILTVFILLPILNLININTSRIMERASEIGVRKAYGASSNTLVFQFLVENILLTLLGGIISILLSSLIIYISNALEIIPHAKFSINWSILLLSLLTFFIFGVLSGVYPAWRMSRMKIVQALKVK